MRGNGEKIMFNQAYEDALEDDQKDARAEEKEVIEQSISMMNYSDQNPSDIKARLSAIYFTNRLWSHFLNDLTSPENHSPDQFKASLISIGIFFLKHVEKMRKSPETRFKPIREISETIAKGLK